jgi:hypothetical protein
MSCTVLFSCTTNSPSSSLLFILIALSTDIDARAYGGDATAGVTTGGNRLECSTSFLELHGGVHISPGWCTILVRGSIAPTATSEGAALLCQV